MQKVEQCRSNCRAQLNNEIFALLSTRFYCLKIDHLIKRIGIIAFCRSPKVADLFQSESAF
ncbi:hypothetical protein EXT42_11980 [Pseudoalteromonas sp. CO302Y]|nr:hypothetical protein EXT42_11980 [Pseudoalteromonas sp. CO302Y]RZG08012.1 hypothetical protein EXT40_12770 [Pseudoalteromonas sp. CO133X]